MAHSPPPQLTPRWVARILGAPTSLDAAPDLEPESPFSGVCTDSRRIRPGCLFVPLKGERFDGHEFIPAALRHGALGVLHDRRWPLPPLVSEPGRRVALFPVDDTLHAYRALGAAWRRCFGIPVVMVAGSAGKTTTKELLSACLRGRWPEVLKTEGSRNGFVGIPMTLLELRPGHGAAVIEVGIDDVGSMRQHVELLHPDISLLTAIGPEHLEKLGDVANVAREEGIALTEVAAQGGQLAVNLDDPWIAPHFERIPAGCRRLGYGMSLGMDPSSGAPSGSRGALPADRLRGRISRDRRSLEVSGAGWDLESFTLPLPGAHNAMNLLCAIAVCGLLGLTAREIREGLATFAGLEGRSQLRELEVPGGRVQVLCDYYNSQPASVAAGLELLSELARRDGARRAQWACLGDMLELGDDEQRYHRELAEPILRLGIENVLLYGPRMAWLQEELRRRGFTGRLRHFEAHSEMAAELRRELGADAVLMIKGSRGMTMEAVWKELDRSPRTEALSE